MKFLCRQNNRFRLSNDNIQKNVSTVKSYNHFNLKIPIKYSYIDAPYKINLFNFITERTLDSLDNDRINNESFVQYSRKFLDV